MARSTTITVIPGPTEGVRRHALLVTSLGSQPQVTITAFAVAESKLFTYTRENETPFLGVDLHCNTLSSCCFQH